MKLFSSSSCYACATDGAIAIKFPTNVAAWTDLYLTLLSAAAAAAAAAPLGWHWRRWRFGCGSCKLSVDNVERERDRQRDRERRLRPISWLICYVFFALVSFPTTSPLPSTLSLQQRSLNLNLWANWIASVEFAWLLRDSRRDDSVRLFCFLRFIMKFLPIHCQFALWFLKRNGR